MNVSLSRFLHIIIFSFSMMVLILTPCIAQEAGEEPAPSEDSPPDKDVQVVRELELERSTAERLENMLQPLVGPTVVMVDLKLGANPIELEGFRYSKTQSLPGLPVSISESAKTSAGDLVEITQMSIRVFVSETMDEEDIDRISSLIPMWLNMDRTRGDQIIIEQVPFLHPPMTMVQFLFSWRVLAMVGGALFLVMLLLLSFYALIRPRKSITTSRGGVGAGVVPSAISGPIGSSGLSAANAGTPAVAVAGGVAAGGVVSTVAGESSSEDNGTKKKGGSAQISSSNMLNLPDGAINVRIVRGQDIRRTLGSLAKIGEMKAEAVSQLLLGESVDTVLFALQLARPDVVAEFLLNQHEMTRARILSEWDKISSIPPESLKLIMDKLRRKLEQTGSILSFLPPSDEMLVNVLNSSSDQQAVTLYKAIEQASQKLAEELRDRVFFIEDLEKLDDLTLRRVLVDIPRSSLAILLKDAPDSLKEKIYSSVSQRMANMIREEAAAMGHVTTEMEAKAKAQLLNNLKRVTG